MNPIPRSPRLTKRQRETFETLIHFIEDHGFQPSKNELAEELGITYSAVYDRLEQLSAKGFLELYQGMNGVEKPRAIRLINVRFKAVFDNPAVAAAIAEGEPAEPPPETEARPDEPANEAP